MGVFGVVNLFKHIINSNKLFYNYVPQRGVRFQEAIKWVKPERKVFYDPARTGDLDPFPKIDKNSLHLEFKDCDSLKHADPKVQKVFSLNRLSPRSSLSVYEQELIDKVKNHALDTTSLEVRIAKHTARIRYYSLIIPENPNRHTKTKIILSKTINKRRQLLRFLRRNDYKKFEWILEELGIEYKPVPDDNTQISRKKSFTLLAKLKVEETKEEKLAAYKKSLDEKKVPFLENKITKLKEIMELEEKYKIPPTVTESDINDCIKKLEEVKLKIAETERIGYKRKIHPFLTEPYNEVLLEEKEKSGSLVREKLIYKDSSKIAPNNLI